MLDMVGEISEFYHESRMIDVCFDVDLCNGLFVFYNCGARRVNVDGKEVIRVLKASSKDIDDAQFLRELGFHDHIPACTIYQQISLSAETKKLKKLYPRIKNMFLLVGVDFFGDSSSVYMDFKGGKILMMEAKIFSDLFEHRLGFFLGMHNYLDLYEQVVSSITDFKKLRAGRV